MNVLAVVAGVPFVVVGGCAAVYSEPLAAWNQKKAAEWDRKRARPALDGADPVRRALNGQPGMYLIAACSALTGVLFIAGGLTNQFRRHHPSKHDSRGSIGFVVGLLLVAAWVVAQVYLKRRKTRRRDQRDGR